MPLTQMQQKKLLRKNASLDGYQAGFLYKAMKELNNPELTERIKREFNSKKRKEEILRCAWENLNNISGKIAKEFFGIRNREDIDKMIKDMRNKKTTASSEKVFAYKGQIITASSKKEAIKKIVADTDDWDSADLGVDAYDKKKSYMYKHNKGDIMEDRSLYSKINNANIKLGKVFEKKLADIIQKHFKGSKVKYVGVNKDPRITLKTGDIIDLEHGWNCIKCDIKKGEEDFFVSPEKRTPPNIITVYVNQRFPYQWKSCCNCNVKSQSSINKCLKIIEDELGKNIF